MTADFVDKSLPEKHPRPNIFWATLMVVRRWIMRPEITFVRQVSPLLGKAHVTPITIGVNGWGLLNVHAHGIPEWPSSLTWLSIAEHIINLTVPTHASLTITVRNLFGSSHRLILAPTLSIEHHYPTVPSTAPVSLPTLATKKFRCHLTLAAIVSKASLRPNFRRPLKPDFRFSRVEYRWGQIWSPTAPNVLSPNRPRILNFRSLFGFNPGGTRP